MGVKTQVFGPHAWNILDFLARAYDRAISTCRERNSQAAKDTIRTLRGAMIDVMTCMGAALPCVHCRASYSSFTRPGTEQQPNPIHAPTALAHLTDQEARILVYNVHTTVTKKLVRQEKEAMESRGLKWDEKKSFAARSHIDADVYLAKTEHYTLDDDRFWVSMVKFAALAVCDLSRDTCHQASTLCNVRAFFLSICDVIDACMPIPVLASERSVSFRDLVSGLDWCCQDESRTANIARLEEWKREHLKKDASQLQALCDSAMVQCKRRIH